MYLWGLSRGGDTGEQVRPLRLLSISIHDSEIFPSIHLLFAPINPRLLKQSSFILHCVPLDLDQIHASFL